MCFEETSREILSHAATGVSCGNGGKISENRLRFLLDGSAAPVAVFWPTTSDEFAGLERIRTKSPSGSKV